MKKGGAVKKQGKKPKESKSSSSGPESAKISKLVHLAPSTKDYARCLANPSTGPLAGIPSFPAQLTKKFRVWTKGTFSTNTNGFGSITGSPQNSVVNDGACVIFSLAGGTAISNNWTAGPFPTADFDTANSNSEYISSQLGDDPDKFTTRVVSSGLKIRYIGTELNRGGQVVAFSDPSHQSLYLRTATLLDAEEQSRRFPVNREWFHVFFRPVDVGDTDFATTIPAFTPATIDHDFFMGFVVTAPSGGLPATFEYEFFTVHEVFGKNIRAMTPSHFDAAGYAAVHAVSNLGANLYPGQLKGPQNEVAMVKDVVQYLSAQSSGVSHSVHAARISAADVAHATQVVKNVVDVGATVANVGMGIWDFFTSW